MSSVTRSAKKQGRQQSSGRREHLQPVPDIGLEVDAVFDLDPAELIESIYAGIAHDVGKARNPLDVECGIAEWLSITTHMILSGMPDGEGDRAIAGFFGALIEVAQRHATPEALALLRALSVLTGTPAAEVAGAAAGELAASGIADRAWVAKLGRLQPTTCLRYGDIDGHQESLVAGFSYGRAEHAVMVLIDHDLGGGIKDCWVTAEPETARQKILTTLPEDPRAEVGSIAWFRAQRILTSALSRPICAAGEHEMSETSANIALLRRRVDVLGGQSWQPIGYRARAPRLPAAEQDTLVDDPPRPAEVASTLDPFA